MTRDELLQTITRTASSATLDLGRTKVYVLETDEHLSDEAIGHGRLRTLVVLEGPPPDPPAPPDPTVTLWAEALAALVARWRERAAAGKAPRANVYAHCAKELETALLKR